MLRGKSDHPAYCGDVCAPNHLLIGRLGNLSDEQVVVGQLGRTKEVDAIWHFRENALAAIALSCRSAPAQRRTSLLYRWGVRVAS